jgi:hypothetical protein
VSDESLPSKPGVERTENLALRSPHENSNARGSNPMSEGMITPARRVRHEVRDSIAVMAFSALSSFGIAALLTFLVRN